MQRARPVQRLTPIKWERVRHRCSQPDACIFVSVYDLCGALLKSNPRKCVLGRCKEVGTGMRDKGRLWRGGRGSCSWGCTDQMNKSDGCQVAWKKAYTKLPLSTVRLNSMTGYWTGTPSLPLFAWNADSSRCSTSHPSTNITTSRCGR